MIVGVLHRRLQSPDSNTDAKNIPPDSSTPHISTVPYSQLAVQHHSRIKHHHNNNQPTPADLTTTNRLHHAQNAASAHVFEQIDDSSHTQLTPKSTIATSLITTLATASSSLTLTSASSATNKTTPISKAKRPAAALDPPLSTPGRSSALPKSIVHKESPLPECSKTAQPLPLHLSTSPEANLLLVSHQQVNFNVHRIIINYVSFNISPQFHFRVVPTDCLVEIFLLYLS